MEQFLRIGVITATHGLRGEVKVYPVTDTPERFETLKDVFLLSGKERIPLKVAHVHYFKQYVLLSFAGKDRIEDVEHFVKKELYVARADAVPLDENEYYIADLIGMRVITDDGETVGTIADVMQTGANDVYIVKNGPEEILIPAIRDCIRNVDPAGAVMTVHLLPGLREGGETE